MVSLVWCYRRLVMNNRHRVRSPIPTQSILSLSLILLMLTLFISISIYQLGSILCHVKEAEHIRVQRREAEVQRMEQERESWEVGNGARAPS